MIKKTILFLVVLSVIGIYNLAFSAARVATPAGEYVVTDGNVKLVAKIGLMGEDLFDLTANFYDFGIFGGELACFSFVGNTFSINYPGDGSDLFTGTWTQKGSQITLATDLNGAYNGLYDYLESLIGEDLPDLGITPIFNNSFTGTLSKNGKTLRGTYKITVTFAIEGQKIPGVRMTISGQYVATSSEALLAPSHTRTVYATENPLTKKEIAKNLGQTIRAIIVNGLKN